MVAEASGGDQGDLRCLLVALSAVHADDDVGAARATLRLLAGTPRLLIRLDERVRHSAAPAARSPGGPAMRGGGGLCFGPTRRRSDAPRSGRQCGPGGGHRAAPPDQRALPPSCPRNCSPTSGWPRLPAARHPAAGGAAAGRGPGTTARRAGLGRPDRVRAGHRGPVQLGIAGTDRATAGGAAPAARSGRASLGTRAAGRLAAAS